MLVHLTELHPGFENMRKEMCCDSKLTSTTISAKAFTDCRDRILNEQVRLETGAAAGSSEQAKNTDTDDHTIADKLSKPVIKALTSFFSGSLLPSQHGAPPLIKDNEFLAQIPILVAKHPELTSQAEEALTAAHNYFAWHIKSLALKAARRLEDHQRIECIRHLKLESDRETGRELEAIRVDFLRAVKDAFVNDPNRFRNNLYPRYATF